MPCYRRIAAREEHRSKTMGLAAAELSAAPDPRLVLRKRLRDEMEALDGILRKAELVVSNTVGKGGAAPAPRRGKDGRFLAAEARSEAMDADRTPCVKRRKAMPPVEIIEPPPEPQISKADRIPCAKKMRTTPPPPVEPRISKDEIFRLVTRLSSLSSNMPASILEFLHMECTGHSDEKAGAIEIDLGSMRRSAMFELQKLLDDEFAEEEKQKEESMNVCRSTSRSSPRELEEGEFVEDEDCGATTNPCGGNASPVAAGKGLCSLPRIHDNEEEEEEEEEVDICGDASPVEIEKFVEIEKSPSPSSSNSSSSSSSSGSSSSGSASSVSSSSDSSDSNSSDSDCDEECVTSNPAHADVPKTDTCPMIVPHKVLGPSPLLEDGEIEEEHESSGVSPVAAEKFAETVNNRTGSANGQCVRSSPAPAVRPEPSKPQPAAHCAARHFYAKGCEKKCERAVAAQGTARHFYANYGFEKKRERDAAAEGTARYLFDNAFEKTRERQRAYEELEEMERKAKAKPIFDWIDPRHLRQLGIIPARRSCPLQSILGLFLKAE